MAFLESPFEKVNQRGDSIALAVKSSNIQFPSNALWHSWKLLLRKFTSEGNTIAMAVKGSYIQFPSNALWHYWNLLLRKFTSLMQLLNIVGQGPTVLAAGAGRVSYILYIFHLSSLSNVWETAEHY